MKTHSLRPGGRDTTFTVYIEHSLHVRCICFQTLSVYQMDGMTVFVSFMATVCVHPVCILCLPFLYGTCTLHVGYCICMLRVLHSC